MTVIFLVSPDVIGGDTDVAKSFRSVFPVDSEYRNSMIAASASSIANGQTGRDIEEFLSRAPKDESVKIVAALHGENGKIEGCLEVVDFILGVSDSIKKSRPENKSTIFDIYSCQLGHGIKDQFSPDGDVVSSSSRWSSLPENCHVFVNAGKRFIEVKNVCSCVEQTFESESLAEIAFVKGWNYSGKSYLIGRSAEDGSKEVKIAKKDSIEITGGDFILEGELQSKVQGVFEKYKSDLFEKGLLSESELSNFNMPTLSYSQGRDYLDSVIRDGNILLHYGQSKRSARDLYDDINNLVVRSSFDPEAIKMLKEELKSDKKLERIGPLLMYGIIVKQEMDDERFKSSYSEDQIKNRDEVKEFLKERLSRCWELNGGDLHKFLIKKRWYKTDNFDVVLGLQKEIFSKICSDGKLGSDPFKILEYCANKEFVGAVEVFLDNPDILGRHGESYKNELFKEVFRNGKFEVAAAFVERGFDPNILNVEELHDKEKISEASSLLQSFKEYHREMFFERDDLSAAGTASKTPSTTFSPDNKVINLEDDGNDNDKEGRLI